MLFKESFKSVQVRCLGYAMPFARPEVTAYTTCSEVIYAARQSENAGNDGCGVVATAIAITVKVGTISTSVAFPEMRVDVVELHAVNRESISIPSTILFNGLHRVNMVPLVFLSTCKNEEGG